MDQCIDIPGLIRIQYADTPSLIRLKHIIGNNKSNIPSLISASHETIYKWIREGKFPKPIKIGKMSFWRLEEVLTFIEKGKWEAKNDC